MMESIDNFMIQYFGLFPIASLGIFLIFAALGMWNSRVAWFLSLSTPGAVGLPIMIIGLLLSDHMSPELFIGSVLISVYFLPGFWVFTIVFAFQARNLVKKKWDKMTPYSYIGVAILLGLYWWTDLVSKSLMSITH